MLVRPIPGSSRILFVGNSLIFSGGGVNMAFGGLARAAGHTLTQDHQTVGGYSLSQHLERAQTMAAIRSGQWDVVVLQDYSNGPVKHRQSFLESGETLAREIRAHGAEPALYMTWTYREDHDTMIAGHPMTQALAGAYAALGARIDAPVVPAGLVWQDALDEGMDFYTDLRHQSDAGTYLVACVFYGFLFRQSPEGIGFTHGIEPDHATRLQAFAWHSLNKYIRR